MGRPAAGAERTVPLVAFRYAPGDGHVYTWDGTGPWVRVFRIVGRDPITVVEVDESIDMTGVKRTASAFADRVDKWRAWRAQYRVIQP